MMELASPPDSLRNNTASRLPTYRVADLHRSRDVEVEVADNVDVDVRVEAEVEVSAPHRQDEASEHQEASAVRASSLGATHPRQQAKGRPANRALHETRTGDIHRVDAGRFHAHARNLSTNTIATSSSTTTNTPTTHSLRPKTFPLAHNAAEFDACAPSRSNFTPNLNSAEPVDSTQPRIPTSTPKAQRKPPASHSRNGLLGELWNGPPPAMITQRSYKLDTTATTDWVESQQQQPLDNSYPSSDRENQPPSPAQPRSTRSASDSSEPRATILPIRGFKPTSSRRSTEMAGRRVSTDRDRDSTLRALEGFDNPRRASNQPELDEHNSDDSDLYLRAAREEELARHTSNGVSDSLINRTDSKRSWIGQRSSLPTSSLTLQSPGSRRRGFEQDASPHLSHQMGDHGSIGQALTYHPLERERAPAPLNEINKSRFYGANSRSTPTTPRAFGSREISPESASYGRRPSLPESPSALPQRASYRQSNLSYSTPRTYNSSPLVSRTSGTTDLQDAPEPHRAAEGTESTVESTTAPSTVWDELEDLKSRIHRLELTGKMPSTSGAAISRASNNDRPATATTTVTTMSTSPKRGRGNSISPVETAADDRQVQEIHPLLHSALAKSKPLLTSEVYKALEATTADALAIASMAGSSGQPGPMSSSVSTVGGLSTNSDRLVRRKADSLCRSLTELCLALSDGQVEKGRSQKDQSTAKPAKPELEVRTNLEEDGNTQRPQMSTDLVRVKSIQSSPRALSRLEQRRSSLLASSALPSPRYGPSDASTPTQLSSAGRRTSLLVRSRRGGTEEPEEQDEPRLRAPSRAKTEIGRLRNSPREYVSQEPMPERPLSIHTALPVRKPYTPSGLPTPGTSQGPGPSNLGNRRYMERSTPERDNTSMPSRLIEDRTQRKSSIGQGFGLGRTSSLTRRPRQPSNMDSSPARQNGDYQ